MVGVQLPEVNDVDHQASLDELGRLVDSLGLKVVARVSQKRPALAKSAVLGAGKLKTLAKLTGGSGVIPSGAKVKKQKKDLDEDDDDDSEIEVEEDAPETEAEKAQVVVVDHDLTPSQARNLERATGVEVMDRSSLILEIFRRHARTREAKLQVEIARLAYMAPRLRETGGNTERQAGRGAGESSLELDRRKVRDRIAELRRELADISSEAQVRRQKRAENPVVALVGYTNAGKSSLMRALTGSQVYVADRLFATLDTTVRALHPETRPRVLITDTVGFIKKLPHDLVASFRSTLDEARDADLRLHLVDAADPAFRAQLQVTEEVLAELGTQGPRWLVLNKSDRLDPETQAALQQEFPEAILMSAHRPQDIAQLRSRLIAFFEAGLTERMIFIPYTQQAKVAALHSQWRVLGETHDEQGTHLTVLAPADLAL